MTRTNKFAGACTRCGTRIEASAGTVSLTADGWKLTCAEPCERKPQAAKAPPAAQVGDLTGIMALFGKAKQHLKFPAIVMSVPAFGADYAIRINVAGEQARAPGSLTVVENERDPVSNRRPWLGRVRLDGSYEASSALRSSVAEAVLDRLQAFARDPAGVAADHGRLTGRCCFCNTRLKDERSTAVGYGQTCASHYGLPWGVARHAFEVA